MYIVTTSSQREIVAVDNNVTASREFGNGSRTWILLDKEDTKWMLKMDSLPHKYQRRQRFKKWLLDGWL